VNAIKTLETLKDMKAKNLKFEIVKEQPKVLSIEEKTRMKIQKAKEALESIFNVRKPSESTFSVQEMNMDGEKTKTTQVNSKMNSKEEKMDEVHLKNEIFDFIKIEDFKNVEQEERESIEILINGSNPVKFLLDSGSDTQIMSLEEY
jgi:hypothetical protein